MNECAVCYKESELLCQRCRIPYCSRRCQAEDWPEHKATCIPMPLLVAVKKPESAKSRHQLNESVSSVSQRLKRYANDSEQTPKQQENVSELKPKQEAAEEETPLRPPKTKLPSEVITPADTDDATSLFDNPFKRNSQNIGFMSNDNQNRLPCPAAIIPSSNQTKKTEAQPTPEPSVPESAIVNETTVPASVKSSVDDETEKAVIIPQASLQNLSLNEEKEEVVETEQVVESKKKIYTFNDIEIVPLIPDKKIVCLDSSHIDQGYVSACLNDGKAVAFIDRMSSKIDEYCVSQTNDSYRPQTGELCLCLFDEDNEWYRAVVTNVIDPENFQIEFIDFGNSSTVGSKNIRKMPRKFLHPCLVNKCYIRGYEDASTETKFKIEEFFSTHTIFEVENMVPLARGAYAIELGC